MIARRIRAGLLAYGLSPAPAEVLSRYCDALLEQNQVMNLTAITDPEPVSYTHLNRGPAFAAPPAGPAA